MTSGKTLRLSFPICEMACLMGDLENYSKNDTWISYSEPRMCSEPPARLTVVQQGPGSLTSLHKGPSCSPAPRNRQHYVKKAQEVSTAQVKEAQCWKEQLEGLHSPDYQNQQRINLEWTGYL